MPRKRKPTSPSESESSSESEENEEESEEEQSEESEQDPEEEEEEDDIEEDDEYINSEDGYQSTYKDKRGPPKASLLNNPSLGSFGKYQRSKTPHFPSIDQSEVKGLDLIREISEELDTISTQISLLSARKPWQHSAYNIPTLLPKPTQRKLMTARETQNNPIVTESKPKKRVVANYFTFQ